MNNKYIYGILALIAVAVLVVLFVPEYYTKSTAFTNKGNFMFVKKDGTLDLVSGDTLDAELNSAWSNQDTFMKNVQSQFGGYRLYPAQCQGGSLFCGKKNFGIGCDRRRQDAGFCVGGQGWTRLLYSDGKGDVYMGVLRH